VATEPTVSRREQASSREDVGRRHAAPNRREPSLRPARWPARPRTSTLLRAAVVAALLTIAAGVLYSQEPAACPSAPAAAGATAAHPTAAPPTDRPLPIPHGLVGVPVRLAEPAALAVVRPGGRVDLLAVPSVGNRMASGRPGVVAPSALVLDVLADESEAPSAVLLALDPEQAQRTVALPDTTRFAVILR
jgi:hypothetical protein